ncbi:MAG: CBS domain-containing protein, partial [Actinobacteria bacterium]|nr:CBS domain-containing protein [Actinomycetota bacterium]
MTTVREVMSTDKVTVEPSTMMIEAVRAMSKARVGSVLVLEDGAVVGIFTERDVLRAFDQMHADPARVSPMS